MFEVVDYLTKSKVTVRDLVFTGESAQWEVQMDMNLIKKNINYEYFSNAIPKLSKYLPLMPIKNMSSFTSLTENATPLIKSKKLGAKLGIDLYFKIESKNPTGSFKDRGSAVDISVAKELGAKAIILASTGNMAASCACYAAAADLPCFVVVPENVSMAKLAQVISYGGKIIKIKGTYDDAAKLAYEIAKSRDFYLAGNYAYRVEGQKTAAFEISDQLYFKSPDMVVIPMGCGTNLAAYGKGFSEYHNLGFLNKMPKLIGVQAQGAKAIVNSFEAGTNEIEKLTTVDTIATAIAVAKPNDGVKALEAIRSTGGEAFAVSDKDILAAQLLLSSQECLFVEAASATTLAYLLKKVECHEIQGSTVVCVLTGDGLKDPNVILKSAEAINAIEPELSSFSNIYNKYKEVQKI